MTERHQITLRRGLLTLILLGSLLGLGSNPQRLWRVFQGWCIEVSPEGREEIIYGAACDLRLIKAR